jgi:hypothetical protein
MAKGILMGLILLIRNQINNFLLLLLLLSLLATTERSFALGS